MCDVNISVLSLLEKWPLQYWNSFVNCRCRSVLNCIFYHSFSYLELKPLLIEAVHKVIEVQTCKKAKVNSTLEGFCPFKIVCNLHCLSGYAIRFSHAVLVCSWDLPVVYNRTEMTLMCFCCGGREHPFLLSGFLDLFCPQPTAFCGSRPVEKHGLGPALRIDIVD